MSADADTWLSCLERKPNAKYRLVYFAWSGNRCGRGSDCDARKPTSWSSLSVFFEVWEVLLPGRGRRMAEPCASDVSSLTAPLARAIQHTICNGPQPFVFVGFSFGAILAHEVAIVLGTVPIDRSLGVCTAELRDVSKKRPLLVVAVGCAGPAWDGRHSTSYHVLSDEDFIDELRRRGGTEELLAMPELLPMFLPVVRADVALEETYTPDPAHRSPVPVLAIHGAREGPRAGDTLVTVEDARLWLGATDNAASCVVTLDGFDWFLLETEAGARAVLDEVERCLIRLYSWAIG